MHVWQQGWFLETSMCMIKNVVPYQSRTIAKAHLLLALQIFESQRCHQRVVDQALLLCPSINMTWPLEGKVMIMAHMCSLIEIIETPSSCSVWLDSETKLQCSNATCPGQVLWNSSWCRVGLIANIHIDNWIRPSPHVNLHKSINTISA